MYSHTYLHTHMFTHTHTHHKHKKKEGKKDRTVESTRLRGAVSTLTVLASEKGCTASRH